jgi:hypothetical protein
VINEKTDQVRRTGRWELTGNVRITSMQTAKAMSTAKPIRAGRKKIRAAGQNLQKAIQVLVVLT